MSCQNCDENARDYSIKLNFPERLDGEDNQVLTIVGNTLSISNGNTITLPISPDLDQQTLNLTGNVLSISNGNSVTLPTPPDLDQQTLSLVGNTLSISNGNSVTLPATTHSLSLSGTILTSIVNGIVAAQDLASLFDVYIDAFANPITIYTP